MNKLSDKNIKKLIWGLSTVICCLLIYFVCLPFYQDLSSSDGSITGVKILILLVFTIFLLLIILLVSYVTALFLIDCLRLSQQTLIKNKITGMLTTMIVLIVIISPMVTLKKVPDINELFQAFIFWLIIPITVILLSRFVLQKTRRYPILFGLASLIAFNIFIIIYSFETGMGRGEGEGVAIFILFESIAVGLVSIVVNLIEKKKINEISGRAIK
jgi:hypothetical protein